MRSDRLPRNDPRTVARDIPGIFDALFPQLVPGVVAHFNREHGGRVANCHQVPKELIAGSSLDHAMLFEVAVAAGEQLLEGRSIDWPESLAVAVERQRKHFDAKLPESLSAIDLEIVLRVGENLVTMLALSPRQFRSAQVAADPRFSVDRFWRRRLCRRFSTRRSQMHAQEFLVIRLPPSSHVLAA
jgi:hypothetical protein